MRRNTLSKFVACSAFLATLACGKSAEPVASASAAPTGEGAPATPTEGAPAGGPDGPESITVPGDLAYSTKPEDIAKGEQVYNAKGCGACHKIGGGKLVGPDLKGVTARRSVKWIGRMILKPEVMIKEDEVAKQLFKEHMTPMGNQGIDPATELPALVSFLKSKE